MSQTLVRERRGHGPANASLLPVTSAALRERNPAALAAIDAAAGEPVESAAARFAALAGVARLRDTGVEESALEVCSEAAAARPELAFTPPKADAAELLELYRRAW